MKQSQLRKTLAATEAQLVKARADLSRAQQKVQTLTQRIPELQRAVDSLRVLCGVKHKPAPVRQVPEVKKPLSREELLELVKNDPSKLVGLQDLTGVGSIPYGSGPVVPELEEDELLPEPEGDTLLE